MSTVSNSVNSVNSYSTVLPPSPMVFFTGPPVSTVPTNLKSALWMHNIRYCIVTVIQYSFGAAGTRDDLVPINSLVKGKKNSLCSMISDYYVLCLFPDIVPSIAF